MWLEGYEYTDIERKTGHSGFSVQRYLSGFSKAVRFYSRGYSLPEIRELTDMAAALLRSPSVASQLLAAVPSSRRGLGGPVGGHIRGSRVTRPDEVLRTGGACSSLPWPAGPCWLQLAAVALDHGQSSGVAASPAKTGFSSIYAAIRWNSFPFLTQ